MSEPRRYRAEYISVHALDESKPTRSVYIGAKSNWFAIVRQWCVDNGYSRTSIGETPDGFVVERTNWGITTEDGRVNVRMIDRAIDDFITRTRREWPDEAKSLCERYEEKLNQIMKQLDDASDSLEASERETSGLRSKLVDAERRAAKGEAAAEDLKNRLRALDPERIRREVANEIQQSLAATEATVARLSSELYEAKSHVSKLSEDKKRLRVALNSARGR